MYKREETSRFVKGFSRITGPPHELLRARGDDRLIRNHQLYGTPRASELLLNRAIRTNRIRDKKVVHTSFALHSPEKQPESRSTLEIGDFRWSAAEIRSKICGEYGSSHLGEEGNFWSISDVLSANEIHYTRYMSSKTSNPPVHQFTARNQEYRGGPVYLSDDEVLRN